MNVGLLTIHDIYNYGSILQAYATQRAIENVGGGEVEIIDYKYPNPVHEQAPKGLPGLKSRLLSMGNAALKDLLPGKKFTRYKKNYKSAKDQWYRLSSSSYAVPEQIQLAPPRYDVYMIGSDQVWHPRTAGKDSTFFLDFAPAGAKRCSYASSFSVVELPEPLVEKYANGLRNFDFISVREKNAVEIVRKLIGRTPELVLDPTLLLSRLEWATELNSDFNLDKPYILCYGDNPGSTYMEELALKFSSYTGWTVVRLNGKFYDYFSRKFDYVLDAGPREFLSLFNGASLILAQSFHATAFAINFQRPFFSILRGNPAHDSRQVNLLKLVGLERNIITCGEDISVSEKFIDGTPFHSAESILKDEREKSFSYLADCLRA